MENQDLFCLKDKSKELKCRLLQFSFDALRVNINGCTFRGSKLPYSCFSPLQ